VGYGITTLAQPAVEPVSLAEAKAHLNVAHTDDDSLISVLIGAAREQSEIETNRRWVNRTVRMTIPRFPQLGEPWCDVIQVDDVSFKRAIVIPFEPVSAVNAVRYYDAAGVLRTLVEGTDYLTWLDHCSPLVYPAPNRYWPETQAGRLASVEVECVTGYGDTGANVPRAAKVAILEAVALWYEHRGDSEDPSKMGMPAVSVRLLGSLHTGLYS
jgi:uncharacterized phiE125 gp8 family phage protein